MRTASALPDCLSPWSVIWTPPVHLFSKLKCLSYSWFILQPEAWHPSATPLTLHGISPAELPQHCLWHFRGSFLQPAIMLNQRSLSGPGVQCSQCVLLASFGFSSAVGWFLGPPSSQEVAYASWNFPAPIPVLRFPEAHGAGCLLFAACLSCSPGTGGTCYEADCGKWLHAHFWLCGWIQGEMEKILFLFWEILFVFWEP